MHVTVLTVYRRNPAKAVPAKYQWYGPELFLVHVPIHVMKSKIRFFLGVGPVANAQWKVRPGTHPERICSHWDP